MKMEKEIEKTTLVGFDLRLKNGTIKSSQSTWVQGGTQEEIQEQVKEELRKIYGGKKVAFRITDIFEPSQRIDPSVLFE